MIELIIDIDIDIFLFLNGLHTPWVDTLMSWITNKTTWLPFYLLIIIIIIKHYGIKGISSILIVILVVALADQITSGLMKPFFQRLRPCHNPDISNLVHLVSGCGGKYGFASGHAANSFGLASSLFFIFRINSRYLGWLFFWAFVVSYSRIYVGVHYPLDILTGGMIGIVLGYLGSVLYYRLPGKLRPVYNKL